MLAHLRPCRQSRHAQRGIVPQKQATSALGEERLGLPANKAPCWIDLFGRLGHGNYGRANRYETQPRLVQSLRTEKCRAVRVAAGAEHAMCLGEDGQTWSWGRNLGGCLGRGTIESPGFKPVVAAGDVLEGDLEKRSEGERRKGRLERLFPPAQLNLVDKKGNSLQSRSQGTILHARTVMRSYEEQLICIVRRKKTFLLFSLTWASLQLVS